MCLCLQTDRVTDSHLLCTSLVHYTAGIINWGNDELEAMDRKTRKMMTKYNSLHLRADIDHLYTPTESTAEED